MQSSFFAHPRAETEVPPAPALDPPAPAAPPPELDPPEPPVLEAEPADPPLAASAPAEPPPVPSPPAAVPLPPPVTFDACVPSVPEQAQVMEPPTKMIPAKRMKLGMASRSASSVPARIGSTT